jgi:hypothetical protein
MTKKTYRGHTVELTSEEAHPGESSKKIPILGRRRGTFDSRRQADSYAMELAKLWIDGRLWGANGHG